MTGITAEQARVRAEVSEYGATNAIAQIDMFIGTQSDLKQRSYDCHFAKTSLSKDAAQEVQIDLLHRGFQVELSETDIHWAFKVRW
ncbi:hypothetical protein CMZ84_04155 [Lysobacteraceae bacterium NML93-0399]|nr:hypothetical protein CMZ84_04155 [Xanthomonadaceae bacterium NML93-0399]